MLKESPELNMPCDSIAPAYRFEKSFEVNIPTREDWTNPNQILNDGSRKDLTGSGIFCPSINKQISIPLGKYITVFLTEITAFLNAVDSTV